MKNYLFIISCLFLISCSKDGEIIQTTNKTNTTTPPPPITPTIISNFYFTGLIDGVQHSYYSDSLDIEHTSGLSHRNCDTSNLSYSHIYSTHIHRNVPSNTPIIVLRKGILPYTGNGGVDNTIFRDFFPIGDQTFSFSYFGAGITIFYTDNNGTVWNTLNWPNNQTNSSIKIIEVTENDGPTNLNVLFSINCTLYDDAGNSKEITDAHYYGLFININPH